MLGQRPFHDSKGHMGTLPGCRSIGNGAGQWTAARNGTGQGRTCAWITLGRGNRLLFTLKASAQRRIQLLCCRSVSAQHPGAPTNDHRANSHWCRSCAKPRAIVPEVMRCRAPAVSYPNSERPSYERPSSERPSSEPMSELHSSAATCEECWQGDRAGDMAVP